MGRAKTGEPVSARRRTPTARKKLQRFIEAAEQRGDLDCWRRGRGERDDALASTFETFKAYPEMIARHVERFL